MDLHRPALFWLDAHWSGGPTAGEQNECPVLDEIRAINDWSLSAESCILIDDARLFFGPPPPPHKLDQWPTFTEISDTLRVVGDRYVTVLDDVVIAIPRAYKKVVDAYWRPIAAQHSQAMMGNRLSREIRRARSLLGAARKH